MKRLKKLASVLLSLAVMFIMTVPAFAADETGVGTYSLTIKGNTNGHTYNVYQIFTGDVSGEYPNYVLSNIKYGKNYNPEANEGDKVPANVLAGITDADVFAQNVTLTEEAFKSVTADKDDITISGLPAGYYLIKDAGKVSGNDAATKFILQVVGNTEINVKSSVPSVTKKINEGGALVDISDCAIGDTVSFVLTGTLPSTFDDYKSYKYVFHDTLSKGLTIVNGSVRVYVQNKETNGEDITTQEEEITNIVGISTSSNADGTTELTVTIADLKADGIKKYIKSGSEIVVKYNAVLNENAVVGSPGNENTVTLEFSNNPNKGGEGETGTTPPDEVVVLTYKLDVTKVDGKDKSKKLQGAEFILSHGGKYAVVDSTTCKITGWADNKDEASKLVTDESGTIHIEGLGSGTYYLEETKAPTGYNLLENPIKIEISSSYEDKFNYTGELSSLPTLNISVNDGTAVSTPKTDTVNMTVVNNAGTTLPSTGGMGTTIFYIVGGILVLAAVVLLVTRRRMRHE